MEVQNTAVADDNYVITITPDEELQVLGGKHTGIILSQGEVFPVEYMFDVPEEIVGGSYEITVEVLSIGSGKARSFTVTVDVEAPVCGDGTCQRGEYDSNCCVDCGCSEEGNFCLKADTTVEGLFICDEYEVCGDNQCEENKGESDQSCCFDCPCGSGNVCQSGICKRPLPVLVRDVDRMVTPNDEFVISVWLPDGYSMEVNDRPEGFRDCITIFGEEDDDELNQAGLYGDNQ